MDERTRQRLLDRIERPSQTIGASMPDELVVDGTTVDLRQFVFDCERLETIPADLREDLEATKRTLRRERLERKQRVARADLTVEEAEDVVESVHGIDRALNALEGLDAPDYGERLRQKEREDAREVLALRDVLRSL
ncbi:DUF5788 family protein [Halomarina rubra]|uniref:DUF5788 family protein n=1 Tax=Halomarina rubra TaxID=2071873 RepID=A0ABD6AZA8_9EURY|nr:DUF5788 family protein [Halomarina rubra]